ncbi:sel1 repeat family protein [Rhizobium leguminosarum]|uniref:hypothetical protein n=1 Tax=Rhizobium leguminosarum TaxID=384 RepID=UPI001C97456D|nr:hypothetical protein [Rhizobium leguminosarum]MBY5590896.1 sel1 repeat family protein [Rhizobium leguminosarum]
MDSLTASKMNDEAYSLLKQGNYAHSLAIYLELEADGYGRLLSPNIGYIYDNMQPRDVHKAKYYYGRAVDEGDAYAMHSLGGLLLEEGDLNGAAHLYDLAVKSGNTDCCYPLYITLKRLGATSDANAALDAAARHGDPFAIRDQSRRRLSGKDGFLNVFRGVAQYLGNIPALTGAANEIYARRTSKASDPGRTKYESRMIGNIAKD